MIDRALFFGSQYPGGGSSGKGIASPKIGAEVCDSDGCLGEDFGGKSNTALPFSNRSAASKDFPVRGETNPSSTSVFPSLINFCSWEREITRLQMAVLTENLQPSL